MARIALQSRDLSARRSRRCDSHSWTQGEGEAAHLKKVNENDLEGRAMRHSVQATTTPAGVNVTPNTNGLPGIAQLREIVGAMMTIGLILSVLALIISAIVWALGANSSNPHLAGRGKLGVLVALGAAIVTGASVTLVNFFWNVGQSV